MQCGFKNHFCSYNGMIIVALITQRVFLASSSRWRASPPALPASQGLGPLCKVPAAIWCAKQPILGITAAAMRLELRCQGVHPLSHNRRPAHQATIRTKLGDLFAKVCIQLLFIFFTFTYAYLYIHILYSFIYYSF